MASIFHYTKLNALLDYILPSMKIRTNNLQLMNDPRESLPWTFGNINLSLDELFPGYYSNETQIDCQLKFGELIKDRLQISCFSGAVHTGWNNEMMWAHYGQRHAGVCLEFDEDALLKNIEELDLSSPYVLEPIDYHPKEEDEDWIYWNENVSYEDNVKQNIQRMYQILTLTKSHFWEKEDEKRLVFLNSTEEIFISIKDTIKAVYLGVAFNLDLLPSLENELSGSDIKLFRLIYDGNIFKRGLIKKNEQGVLNSYSFDY